MGIGLCVVYILLCDELLLRIVVRESDLTWKIYKFHAMQYSARSNWVDSMEFEFALCAIEWKTIWDEIESGTGPRIWCGVKIYIVGWCDITNRAHKTKWTREMRSFGSVESCVKRVFSDWISLVQCPPMCQTTFLSPMKLQTTKCAVAKIRIDSDMWDVRCTSTTQKKIKNIKKRELFPETMKSNFAYIFFRSNIRRASN